MKKALCLLLCLALVAGLLISQVVAVAGDNEPDLLKSKGDQFIKENGLTEEDFAVYFFDTRTREEYVYNENAFFPVGNNWILPLHMYYYEHETLGDFNPPYDRPNDIYTIEGMTLEQCRYQSFFTNNSEINRQMRDNLGSEIAYLSLINNEFGHIDPETLPDSYYRDNCYSATFLMNCLKRVTDHPELYQNMMQNFQLIQTDDGFAGYSRQYGITHIRGEQDGPDTYLLVCFASEDVGGDELLARVNELFFKYVEERSGTQQNTTPTDDNIEQNDDKYNVHSKPFDYTTLLIYMGVALAGASVIAAIIGLIIHLIRKREDRRHEERKLAEMQRDTHKHKGQKETVKQAVKCPNCGATTIPDRHGRCEFCNGAVNTKT